MTDARIRYTKQAIRTSFFQLLGYKSIEKITVKELCNLAGINRATFYRYYENQYDLLSIIGNEMLADIKTAIQKNPNDIDALTTLMCHLLYQNRNEWVLLMSPNGDSRFLSKTINSFNQIYDPVCNTEDKQMMYRFMLNGFTGIFDYWVQNNMQESPDQIANYLVNFRHRLVSTNTSSHASRNTKQ